MENNGKVSWSQLGVLIAIVGTILGVLWSEIKTTNNKVDTIDDKVTEIKIDTNVLKVNFGNLLDRINRGQVTIKNVEVDTVPARILP